MAGLFFFITRDGESKCLSCGEKEPESDAEKRRKNPEKYCPKTINRMPLVGEPQKQVPDGCEKYTKVVH